MSASAGATAGVPGTATWCGQDQRLSCRLATWIPETKRSTPTALAGGQIGYNFQTGNFVWGIEGDGSWSNLQGSSGNLTPDPVNFATNGEPYWTFHIKNDWLATARGRLGYAAGPFLFYGTGGAAFGGFTETHNVLSSPTAAYPPVPAPRTGGRSDTQTGWTAGAGVEWAITNNWSAKAEYLCVNFANVGGVSQWDYPAVYGVGTDGLKGDFNIHTVRVGLNYQFH
jgi:outer membrane immunogenic protein